MAATREPRPAGTTARRPAAKRAPAKKAPAKPDAGAARARLATQLGFVPVVEATLAATPLAPGDAAAAHLARALAAAIDRPRTVAQRDDALHRHAPKLLDVLKELGATPQSRRRLVPTGGRASDEPAEPRDPDESPAPTDPTPGLSALRQAHARG